MQEAILKWVDHKHLNYDVPWLEEVIPTTEMLVYKFWDQLAPRLPEGLLYEVRLYETEKNSAFYRGESRV